MPLYMLEIDWSGYTKVEGEVLKWEKRRTESKKGNERVIMTIREEGWNT